MKRIIIFFLCVVTLVLMIGCSSGPKVSPDIKTPAPTQSPGFVTDDTSVDNTSSNGKKVTVNLYFPNPDNSGILVEKAEIDVVDGAILKAAVEALLKGPESNSLKKAIPDGTRLLSINLKNGTAVVDFSKEYSEGIGGSVAEIVERFSVVNTLADIKGVDRVRIMVEGKDLIGPSGKPFGEMRKILLDDKGFPLPDEKKQIVLYFSNDNADYLVAERREVIIYKGESLEKLVFEELARGPRTNTLHAVIPKGSRVLAAAADNGTCTIDLSKEFVENSKGGTASEIMAIYSVVNSLTEIEGIEKVQFLIEGKERKIYTHMEFDEPFSRNESLIKK